MSDINFDLSDVKQTPLWMFYLKTIEEFVSCLAKNGFDNNINLNLVCRISPYFSDKIAINAYDVIQIDEHFLKKIIVATHMICEEYRLLGNTPIKQGFDKIDEKKELFVAALENVDESWNDFEKKCIGFIPEDCLNVVLACVEFMIGHEMGHAAYRNQKLDSKEEEFKCDQFATDIVAKLINNALLNGHISSAKNMLLGTVIAQFHIAEQTLEKSDFEQESSTHPFSYNRLEKVLNSLNGMNLTDDYFALPLYYFAIIYRINCNNILTQETSFLAALKDVLKKFESMCEKMQFLKNK